MSRQIVKTISSLQQVERDITPLLVDGWKVIHLAAETVAPGASELHYEPYKGGFVFILEKAI